MNTSEFKTYLGGTAVCMKRIAMANKGCGQLTSNETYFADIWFIPIKTADEAMAAGLYYCGPVKTSHKGFFFSYVRKVDERLAGRVISCFEE